MSESLGHPFFLSTSTFSSPFATLLTGLWFQCLSIQLSSTDSSMLLPFKYYHISFQLKNCYWPAVVYKITFVISYLGTQDSLQCSSWKLFAHAISYFTGRSISPFFTLKYSVKYHTVNGLIQAPRNGQFSCLLSVLPHG